MKERVHSSTMKTTKGSKVMSPTDAYQKELCEKKIEKGYSSLTQPTFHFLLAFDVFLSFPFFFLLSLP